MGSLYHCNTTANGIGAYSTLWGIVIFFLILFWIFNGRNAYGHGNDYNGCCPGTSGCEVQKSEIINSARTQYLVEEQANLTRVNDTANANMLATKIDFYAYQDLRDKLNKAEMNNFYLQNKLDTQESNAQLNARLTADNNELNRRLDSISCEMLKRPNITGVGAVCPNAGVINSLGFNGFNNGCCGSNFA